MIIIIASQIPKSYHLLHRIYFPLNVLFIGVILVVLARIGIDQSANLYKREVLFVMNLAPRHIYLNESGDNISTDFLAPVLH